jgi:hypothetical protein
MISETLAAVLQSGRTEFNSRYEAARQRYPGLDSVAFSKFIVETIDPLTQGAARITRDRVSEVVTVAYDIGLELVGQKLIGKEARGKTIDAALRRMYPFLMPLIVMAPERILPAIYNALHNLTSTAGARPEQWAEILGRTGVQCEDPGQLLKLGQVLGWRAGLAHYRSSALAIAAALPPKLLVAALGAGTNDNWSEIAGRLETDPWFDPVKSGATTNRSRVEVVAKVGGFRGFGGLFSEPPQVASSREHLWVKSGDDCWLLCADVFGSTFHRATMEEFESALKNPFSPEGLVIDRKKIGWNNRSLNLPAEIAGSAATLTTLAVTNPGTFAISLIACV